MRVTCALFLVLEVALALDCPAGSYDTKDWFFPACKECPRGTASPPGSDSCRQCAPGTYALPDGSACRYCKQNTFASLPGSTSCLPCPTNFRSGVGASACTDCGEDNINRCSSCIDYGTYDSPDRSGCLSCPINTINPTDQNGLTNDYFRCVCKPPYFDIDPLSQRPDPECDVCSAGTFRDASSNTCQACPQGTFSPLGSDSCIPCAPGTYALPDRTACRYCPGDSFSAAAGSTSCSLCSNGTRSGVGATSCTDCSSGCRLCPANTYATAYFEVCTACPAGAASKADSTSCSCTGVFYDPNPSSGRPDPKCEPCPPGSFDITTRTCSALTANLGATVTVERTQGEGLFGELSSERTRGKGKARSSGSSEARGLRSWLLLLPLCAAAALALASA